MSVFRYITYETPAASGNSGSFVIGWNVPSGEVWRLRYVRVKNNATPVITVIIQSVSAIAAKYAPLWCKLEINAGTAVTLLGGVIQNTQLATVAEVVMEQSCDILNDSVLQMTATPKAANYTGGDKVQLEALFEVLRPVDKQEGVDTADSVVVP